MNRTRQSWLAKLEQFHQVASAGPLFLLANYPIDDTERIFADWPTLVAEGRASVRGNTLYLTDYRQTAPLQKTISVAHR